MTGTPYTVSEVMTRTVVAVGRDASFKEIVRSMQEWNVSAVPVLDEARRVVGIVSEADLLPTEVFRDRAPRLGEERPLLAGLAKAGAGTAQELMTAPAVTVHAEAPLAEAARSMAVRGVKRLPVVDDEGALQGIVSRVDLLKVFLRPDEDIAEEVRRTVVAELFPAARHAVHVAVHDGVVTLTGHLDDTTLIAVAVRLTRAVEGVVDVEPRLTGRG